MTTFDEFGRLALKTSWPVFTVTLTSRLSPQNSLVGGVVGANPLPPLARIHFVASCIHAVKAESKLNELLLAQFSQA